MNEYNYLLYVRRYDFDYMLNVYKVNTKDIFHTIGRNYV